MNYIITGPIKDPKVELWSTRRLPFEPKGWLKVMRDDLKKELKSLQRGPNDILYGCYQSSTNETGYDIENILFYNVGSSAFSHLGLNGICFEKGPTLADAPVELDEPIHSYSLYRILPVEQLSTFWKRENIIASWENVEVIGLKDAYSYWGSMRRAGIKLNNENKVIKNYGIDITLHLPEKEKFSLPSESMKKMLDGVICSFHVHDGLNEVEISERLAAKLQINKSISKQMLQDDSTNILGRRSVFHLYREDSLLCNPADDQCVFVNISIVPAKGTKVRMSGQLFTLKPNN